MAITEGSASKKANSDDTKYTIDNVIPVLLASQGNPTVNHKVLAAMDDLGRTEYAWQHRFRRWKAAAKEIVDAHPNVVAAAPGGTPVNTPTKKAATRTGKGKAAKAADDDTDDDVENAACTPKSDKKRVAAREAGSASPTKKAKGGKKGTAQKVRKASKGKAGNAGEEGASVDEEAEVDGVKHEVDEENVNVMTDMVFEQAV